LEWLNSINLGTIDDLTEDTQEFRDGITIKYIKEVLPVVETRR